MKHNVPPLSMPATAALATVRSTFLAASLTASSGLFLRATLVEKGREMVESLAVRAIMVRDILADDGKADVEFVAVEAV